MENSYDSTAVSLSPLSEENTNNTTAKPPSPITLYQIVDSTTPTGGFAHSNTIEVARQLNLITDTSTLLAHTWDVLLQTVTSILPFLTTAHKILYQATNDNNGPTTLPPSVITAWSAIDAAQTATTTSHVSKRASLIQGSALFRTFSRTFPHINPALKLLKRAAKKRKGGHAATTFGAVAGLLALDEKTTVSLFMYNVTRDMINAAVRLNVVGPLEGTALTRTLGERWEAYFLDEGVCDDVDGSVRIFEGSRIVDGCVVLEEVTGGSGGARKGWSACEGNGDVVEDAHVCAPVVEILANLHDRLYTRLFNS